MGRDAPAAHANDTHTHQGSDLYLRDERTRNKQIVRLLGKVPTLAAVAYRQRIGR